MPSTLEISVLIEQREIAMRFMADLILLVSPTEATELSSDVELRASG